ncbi:MAG: exosortase K [Gammaproteobacteria bacterium]
MLKQNRYQIVGWGITAMMVMLIKYYYSGADTTELQWLLRPLAVLLELISPLSFQSLENGEWLDAQHHIRLVKACAGGNFFIISLLGYLWLLPLEKQPLRRIVAAFSAAWLTTLLANSLRILLSVYAAEPLANCLALSSEQMHRLIGIVSYFLTISMQLSADRRRTFSTSLPAAAGLYLTVTLIIPLLRSWVDGHNGISLEHAVWVVSVPMALVGAVSLRFGCVLRLRSIVATFLLSYCSTRLNAPLHDALPFSKYCNAVRLSLQRRARSSSVPNCR